MNPSEHDLSRVDPETLDLLVDGELPDAERRKLLLRLEQVPGGWRACALAFLAAQCLREAMDQAARQPLARPQIEPLRPVRRSTWMRRVQPVLAVAAGFLLALGFGWLTGTWRGASAPGPGGAVAPDLIAGRTDRTGLSEDQPVAVPEPAAGREVMTVALPAAWSATGQEVRVPVVERDQLDHSLLFPDTAAFPAELREALRRAGYHVQQSRSLLPVPAEGGRQAVLPVDQLQIRYVGNHVE